MTDIYEQMNAIRQSISDLSARRATTEGTSTSAALLQRMELLQAAIASLERLQNLRVAMKQVLEHA